MRVALACLALALAVLGVSGQTTDDHNKIVACYHASWAYYRPDNGRFDVYNFDPTMCTHGIYAYANIDTDNWVLKSDDPFLDYGPGDNCNPGECVIDQYRRFVALKAANADFIPMLSVGGWNAGSGSFSQMAADPAKRATFIQSMLDHATIYGFEGFDIDWEFPGTGSGSDETIDKEDFAVLLEETRAAFDSDGRGLVLSAALSAKISVIDGSYDIPRVFDAVDFGSALTYEYHGFFPPSQHYTGMISPLYRRPEEGPANPGYQLNVYDTINAYLGRGAPRSKLNLAIASNGRGFILTDEENNGLYCDADGPNPGGPWTGTDGTWSYGEILFARNTDDFNGILPGATPGEWETVVDTCYLAPYMYNGPHWISYDDPESVGYKIQYANYANLAGATYWSMDMDDFRGTFSANTYPILRSINDNFAGGIAFNPENPTCGSAPMCYYTEK